VQQERLAQLLDITKRKLKQVEVLSEIAQDISRDMELLELELSTITKGGISKESKEG